MNSNVKAIRKVHILFTVFFAWLIRSRAEEFVSLWPVLLVLFGDEKEKPAKKSDASIQEDQEETDDLFLEEERRFITEDPIKDGLNWYVYTGNNPINFVDLNGLERLSVMMYVGTTSDGETYEYAFYCGDGDGRKKARIATSNMEELGWDVEKFVFVVNETKLFGFTIKTEIVDIMTEDGTHWLGDLIAGKISGSTKDLFKKPMGKIGQEIIYEISEDAAEIIKKIDKLSIYAKTIQKILNIMKDFNKLWENVKSYQKGEMQLKAALMIEGVAENMKAMDILTDFEEGSDEYAREMAGLLYSDEKKVMEELIKPAVDIIETGIDLVY